MIKNSHSCAKICRAHIWELATEAEMQATCQGPFFPQHWMFDVHFISVDVQFYLWVPVIELSIRLELWLTVVGAHWPARDAIGSDWVVASSSVHAPGLAWLFQQFCQSPKKRQVCTPSVSQQGTWQTRVSDTNQTWFHTRVSHSVQVTSHLFESFVFKS